MVGLKYPEYKELPAHCQMKTFYISVKFIVAFHVNMMPQLHLPVNMRKHHLKLFNLFNIAINNINSTFKLERKLD